MSDREEAIDILTRMSTNHFYGHREQEAFKLGAKALSAERRGRWIMHIDDLFPEESTMECDQCHEEQPLTCDDKYCPNCGARMEADE